MTRTSFLLMVAVAAGCSTGDDPPKAVVSAAPAPAAPAGGSPCIETRPLISDDEARAFLGGLSGAGKCHTCGQSRGFGSGCAWQLEGRSLMPDMLDAQIVVYQPGNDWETARSVRLRSGMYKDLPALPGGAHGAVIMGQLQIIMHVKDRVELLLMMTAPNGAAVEVPDKMAALARTAYQRARGD